MYYFYCPNCGKEDRVERIPRGTVGNIRDGFGTPIHHYECSDCHNLDAGFMKEKTRDGYEKKYYQPPDVIGGTPIYNPIWSCTIC